jgi:hypothetical protein
VTSDSLGYGKAVSVAHPDEAETVLIPSPRKDGTPGPVALLLLRGAPINSTFHRATILHREIDRLPERHRIAIVLCDLEGRSYEEAARQLGCPVGTVKSRLARARERLRHGLARRGVAPTVLAQGIDRLPEGLVASTVRGSLMFATDPVHAAGVVSTSAVALAEGVRKTMIRVRLHAAVLAALAVTGLLAPAWLAVARQAPDDRARLKAPPAGKAAGLSAVGIGGNWIVRIGEPLGVIRIEGPPGQRRARLLSLGGAPGTFDVARSRLDRVRIDESTVRFTLQLFRVGPPSDILPFEIVAHRFGDEARPSTLRGAYIHERGSFAGGKGLVTPTTLERTDRAELDPKAADAAPPGLEEFRRGVDSKDPAEQKRILEGILAKYGEDAGVALRTAQSLAIIRADAGAPNEEVRGLIDRAARIASRDGREMEIFTIGLIADNVAGAEGRDDLALEYARRAVAMLRPEDSADLQIPTIQYLVAALRRSRGGDEKAAAEVQALGDRIATLGGQVGRRPAPAGRTGAGAVPWAWSFTAASEKARADGKLVMVVFYTEGSRWWEHLDAEVFPRPDVVAAIRPFVPVQVDTEGGDGRALAAKYRAHVGMISPIILFLDPANPEAEGGGVVARIPGMIPTGTLIEGLQTIARLPRDLDALARKAHPDDGDAMRQLATALAIRGRIKDATALIDRAWGPGADPGFDRWAAVYNALGIELMMRLQGRAASDWFHKAAGVAKRPIDVYNAHLGAGFAAMLQIRGDLAAREFEAAARVDGVSVDERDFARGVAADPARALRRPPRKDQPSSAPK